MYVAILLNDFSCTFWSSMIKSIVFGTFSIDENPHCASIENDFLHFNSTDELISHCQANTPHS